MTLAEARQHLAQVAANPNAQFIHQDFVEESRRLGDAKDDAAHALLEEALARAMLEGDDTEMMAAADALMAIPVRESVLRTIASALTSLSPQRRDAAMRVLGVHRTSLPKDVVDDLDALFMAHPREFLRLALAVLPDAVKPRLAPLWKALLSVASTSQVLDEMVLVTRAAAASNRLDELVKTLKQKPAALVREVARLTLLEDQILGPLQIETLESGLARAFSACTDPLTLGLLVKTAVAAGCVSSLPRWLKQKDPALLQAATGWAGPDERPWLEAILSRP
jgi:hypothetical protein